MCLVKVKGEVEDEVIVPARIVNRNETDITETTIVETRNQPTIIRERYEANTNHSRSHRSRSRRGSVSSSSSDASSSPPRSVRSHRSRSGYHEGSNYGDRERHSYKQDDKPRNQYRYVEPPRGGPGGSGMQVKEEISKAEEHLQRAAELQERERRYAANRKSIGYDPRGSQASYRSYGGNQGRRGDAAEVVVVQESSRTRYRE